MPSFDTSRYLSRVIVMMIAGFFSLAAAGGAVAKNGGSSHDRGDKHSEVKNSSRNKTPSLKEVIKDKNGDKHSKKHKDKDHDKKADKKKDKDKDKTASKEKEKPVIYNGGFVKDKLPNGTVYYRRATADELAKGVPAPAGSTTTSNAPAGGTTTAGNNPPPSNPNPTSPPPAAGPTGDNSPVVRDHRPGGLGAIAYPKPGTIIRDHRNGADGKPVVVVSAGPGGTVTRPATDADLKRAGLQKSEEPGLLDKIGHELNNLPGSATAGKGEKTSTSTQQ